MPHARCLLVLFLAVPILAQDPPAEPPPPPDVVTLTNGDRITGTIETFTDGTLKVTSPLVGELEIPVDNIADIQTGQPVTVTTKGGERLQRNITAIQDGRLVFEAQPGEPAAAGLAIEQIDAINPPPPPGPTWTGALTLGASMSEGNTNRRSATASLDAKRRSASDRITLRGSWVYGEDKQNGRRMLTERNVRGSLQYDYFVGEKGYLLANTAALGDTLANIDLRFTVGAGAGYQWLENDDIVFSTEAGITWYREDFRDMTPTKSYPAARLAYAVLWNISDDVRVLQDLFYIPSLERSDDYVLGGDTRLQFDIWSDLLAEIRWLVDYNSTPAAGADRTDNRFLFTIGWTF